MQRKITVEQITKHDAQTLIAQEQAVVDVFAEMDYQETRFGPCDVTDDTKNTPFHFVTYIAKYASRWQDGSWAPFKAATVDAYRSCMVKVAALALNAIVSLDRQRANNGKASYEE